MWNNISVVQQCFGDVLNFFLYMEYSISASVCVCMLFVTVRLAWSWPKKKSFYRIHDHTLVEIDENDDDDDDNNNRSDGNDDDYEKDHKTQIHSQNVLLPFTIHSVSHKMNVSFFRVFFFARSLSLMTLMTVSVSFWNTMWSVHKTNANNMVHTQNCIRITNIKQKTKVKC